MDFFFVLMSEKICLINVDYLWLQSIELCKTWQIAIFFQKNLWLLLPYQFSGQYKSEVLIERFLFVENIEIGESRFEFQQVIGAGGDECKDCLEVRMFLQNSFRVNQVSNAANSCLSNVNSCYICALQLLNYWFIICLRTGQFKSLSYLFQLLQKSNNFLYCKLVNYISIWQTWKAIILLWTKWYKV